MILNHESKNVGLHCLPKMHAKWGVFFQVPVLLVFLSLAGCTLDSETDSSSDFLIRIGSQNVTVLDFNRALEISKSAYPYTHADDLEIRRRLLDQLVEEAVLLEKAKELQISISEDEAERAVLEITRDYPDDTFEQILLEKAISFNDWKDRLKKRLLMEKVIAIELAEGIEITSEDISHYVKRHYDEAENNSPPKGEPTNITIIKALRREKTEAVYGEWIKDLKKQYAIEINRVQWNKLLVPRETLQPSMAVDSHSSYG
jgi:hypothetical protein